MKVEWLIFKGFLLGSALKQTISKFNFFSSKGLISCFFRKSLSLFSLSLKCRPFLFLLSRRKFEPCQASMMELFGKTVDSFLRTTFAKSSIIDILHGSKYVFKYFLFLFTTKFQEICTFFVRVLLVSKS